MSFGAILSRGLFGGGGDGGGGAPPVVTIISPAVGTGLSSTTPVVLTIEDDLFAFRLVLLVADFPGLGIKEVIHDGNSFSAAYSRLSARTQIAQGYQFSLLRNEGWPASPTITPYAIDTGGGSAG